MTFKNGYLGACIVVLAVMVTIVGAYILSIEVENVETTEYRYITDLNGLFDSEQAPSYIEYNPSTNYTGYYTNNSIINDVRYFDGVDYTPTQNDLPNAYRLNLRPENYTDGTNTSLPSSDTFTGTVQLWGTKEYYPGRVDDSTNEVKTTNILLSDFITQLNLDPDQNLITLKSAAGQDDVSWPISANHGVLYVDWVIFSGYDDWVDSSAGTGKILRVYSDAYNRLMNTNYPLPCLSCKIDLTLNQVITYYDNECTQSANIYALDRAVISFGGTDPSSSHGLMLDDELDYIYETKTPTRYMDIKAGVSVEDQT